LGKGVRKFGVDNLASIGGQALGLTARSLWERADEKKREAREAREGSGKKRRKKKRKKIKKYKK